MTRSATPPGARRGLFASSVEPASVRWRRRVKTIPMMLLATAAGLLALPVVVPLLAVADVLRGRMRVPTVRVYLFLLHYGINDSVEILLAPWYWLLAGFGMRLEGRASIRRHDRIQRWSLRTLARSAERLLGLRIEVDPAALALLEPGPMIVVCRHVSLFDSSLPALLGNRRGLAVRGVIMAELLADPGFDLFYRRTGSVFIARENGPEARAAVGAMGAGLDDRTIVAIFPEGRLFRPELLTRYQAKIARDDPGRVPRVAGLRHLLPPRPGGVGALLDALPEADVVMITHAGLDGYSTFAALARAAPLRSPIQVRVERFARGGIPDDPSARSEWLDWLWADADEWIDRHRTASSRGDVPSRRGRMSSITKSSVASSS